MSARSAAALLSDGWVRECPVLALLAPGGAVDGAPDEAFDDAAGWVVDVPHPPAQLIVGRTISMSVNSRSWSLIVLPGGSVFRERLDAEQAHTQAALGAVDAQVAFSLRGAGDERELAG